MSLLCTSLELSSYSRQSTDTEYASLSVLLHTFDLRIINKYHQLMLIEFVNLYTLIFLEVVEVCSASE